MLGLVRRDACQSEELPESSGPETFLYPPLPPAKRALHVATASAAGGVMEGCLTSWLRVVTIERQLAQQAPPLLQHVRQMGLRTLGRGMPVYTGTTSLATLWCFTVQHLIQTQLHPQAGPVPPPIAALAGMLAGASEAVVTNPARAVMVAMAAPSQRGRSAAQVARTLLQAEGPAALTRGALAGAARNAVMGGLFFPLVAALRNVEHPSPWRDLGAGVLAGALACTVAAPLDALAAQVQSSGGVRPSLAGAAQDMWRKGGMAPFYRGVTANAARTALATGICFFTTMQVMQRLEGRDPSKS